VVLSSGSREKRPEEEGNQVRLVSGAVLL